nr:ATP-dependent DNA helicase RecG [Rhodoferax sp.]
MPQSPATLPTPKPRARPGGKAGESAGANGSTKAGAKSGAKSNTVTTPKSLTQKALEKLGLRRDIDLALHLPLRYEDETRITQLRDAREGDTVQIEGRVTDSEVTFRPRRQLIVTVDDGTDTCTLRFFSFYPSQQKALAVGNRIRARGEVKGGFMGYTMLHPAFRTAGGDLPKALTPIYPTVAGLAQHVLRKEVLAGLARAELSDTFPPGDLSEINPQPLWTLREALSFLHHPTPDVSLDTLLDHSHPAWQRLKAEELLAQQISQLQSRRERAALRAPVLAMVEPAAFNPPNEPEQPELLPLYTELVATLPFKLTAAQHRVCAEIAQDLARQVPMHRLLQGDVGSGKTVVAALAACICIDAGWQCALMAPTEILAEQHFRKLLGWLEPLGITTAWLTGTQKAKERREALAMIESGEAALVVGTHAVIQQKVLFKNLALAIIDEQHRFGVAQRLALRNKLTHDGLEPHMLMMTATPIPRTLAMSYYADLDVSTIDELPPGRTPIITRLVNDARRDEVIERIHAQIAQGRQVYWVCPLIEESEALDLTNATQTHADLVEALQGVQFAAGQPQGKSDTTGGSDPRSGGAWRPPIGLLHSRMHTDDKKAVMGAFTAGLMSVLVSTTVIEVGVDVPNASLMVIEHAERFGLSQLHQLRGRVGRGAAASACVLLYSTGDAPRLSQTARARLKAMAETNDGFEIARRDLDIRGPGEFLGARQSGEAMLRFADLNHDTALLEWARREAPMLLDHHPQLAERHVARWLGGKAEFLKA